MSFKSVKMYSNAIFHTKGLRFYFENSSERCIFVILK